MEILKEFKSSNVKEVKYSPETKQLYVQFLRTKPSDKPEVEYVYDSIESDEFQLIKEAESVGSTLRKVIKGKTFMKVELS